MATVVASGALTLAVLLNLVATVMLVRSDFETPLQKVLQLVFAWVVPYVGSIIVIAVLRGARSDNKPRFASDASGDTWLPGIGPNSDRDEGGGDPGNGGHGGGGGH
jgi:hypothetical protein